MLRGLAGALSRYVVVDVLAPGPPGGTTADGFFDVRTIGSADRPGAWPEPAAASRDDLIGARDGPVMAAMVDATDVEGRRLLHHHAPEFPAIVVGATATPTAGTVSRPGDIPLAPAAIGLHVPVNPIAAQRPHNGFGFTDYLLVLTDRGPHQRSEPPEPSPTPLAAWLIARFPREHVVVVEDATASAWHNRSLRGAIRVDTRTDLWRLMAHARMTVDLHPGALLARECVESLRYGTPVVVPKGTVAASHAAAGGGLWFDDVAELLGCVDALADPEVRTTLGHQAQDWANERHGDPAGFVGRVGDVLTLLR